MEWFLEFIDEENKWHSERPLPFRCSFSFPLSLWRPRKRLLQPKRPKATASAAKRASLMVRALIKTLINFSEGGKARQRK